MAANNAFSLTNDRMTPIKGQGAFLPNQPMLHTCVVSATQTGGLLPGDVVTFDTATTLDNLIVVKKAAAADTPIGIVPYNPLVTEKVANDRISLFDTNSYVYMEAGAADLTAGTQVTVNSTGQVVAATAGQGFIGIVYTQPSVVGDLIVIKVAPGKVAAAAA